MYEFAADGTYRRYFYLDRRLGDTRSGIFSASEGTVTFGPGTFTLHPAKGTYRLVEGRKPPRVRPMERDELERPGLVFTWKLQHQAGGPPALLVVKEGKKPRTFNRGKEGPD